ncbi:DMT family transporter [Alphaproteobacteria bacterium]|nr:DMT family transporter [Alphaproteobacteria bacterium]
MNAFNKLSTEWQATLLMLVAMLLFTVMGVFIRLASETIPVMEVVFFRNFLGAVILLPLILQSGVQTIKMVRPSLFIYRGMINFVGMAAGFTAVTLIPLAEATALNFTCPLFVTLGAAMFLGEIIRIRRIIAIIIGFGGALLILQPGISEISLGAMLALVGAVSIAGASLLVKKMTETESVNAIVLWMVAIQAPISFVPAFFVWQWPGIDGWFFLICLTLAGTIAHICFTRACGLVEITSLQHLEFVKLPFAAAVAWFIFSEIPDMWTWIGGAVIFLSTAYITHREARAHKSLRPNHGIKESKL